MLYGLLELLASALREFHSLAAHSFTRGLFLAGGFTAFMEFVFFLSGRLVRTDWKPNYFLGSGAAVALPLSFILVLLLPASSYLKPAVARLLGVWQQSFLADNDWNEETFRKEYWAVKSLKKPDGSTLENFVKYPAPEDGGHSIPASEPSSLAVIADFDSKRVAEHFQHNFSFLAQLLWAQDRPLPEALRSDMDKFFRDNHGATYEHTKSVKLAGTEMLNLLEQKIERIVLIVRISLILLLAVLWLPLCALAMRDAWKKLEPITG